jgi:hypothetical protein
LYGNKQEYHFFQEVIVCRRKYNMMIEHKSIISLLLILILLVGCSPNIAAVPADQATAESTVGDSDQGTEIVSNTADQAAADSEPTAVVTEAAPEGGNQSGDGIVRGWALLAEKDNYDDVQMTNLPVDYIGVTQLHQLLLDSGWQEAQIHEAREFDQESMTGELDWLAENVDQDDLVFVYVAAHGSYLRNVLRWSEFFGREWEEIPSHRQILLIDSCQAEEFTDAVANDPEPYLSVAAVASGEFGWSGLEEEGLPIIGGVFTHYFTLAFQDSEADTDGDGQVSAQEAALWAEAQQRTYMHEVVFAVPEFVEDYHTIGVYPDQNSEFPHVVVQDTISAPVFLTLE